MNHVTRYALKGAAYGLAAGLGAGLLLLFFVALAYVPPPNGQSDNSGLWGALFMWVVIFLGIGAITGPIQGVKYARNEALKSNHPDR